MKAVLGTILLAGLLGGGGTFLWTYYGGFEGEQGKAIQFIDVYGDYLEIATQVEALVHLPSSERNAYRAELLSLLEAILTEDITASKRDELARLAYANVDVLKREVDSAQIAQVKIYEALQGLDDHARLFSSVDLRTKAVGIVAVARKRAELSARITSILSEINEHTFAIVTRILSDKGELTDAHIVEINDATTSAEQRFDTLSTLYRELEEKRRETETLFAVFVEVAI